MDLFTADEYWIARWLFERALAAIYLIAFVAAHNQSSALLGDDGLTPAREALSRGRFRTQPSLFYWYYSDRFFRAVTWTGMVLSAAAMLGIAARGPIWLHTAWWLVLWFLYLSIVHAGGRFYGFGWETMMVEAGFFTAFLGPDHAAPSIIVIFILRWLLFRVEFGAGLIKLRHDPCWQDLTCLYYHYETQPLPNPLSWYFHRLPKPIHRVSVLFSHVVQLGAPIALFLPQPVAAVGGGLIVLHQLLLMVSGNYSWLNWLTLVLAIPAFPDAVLGGVVPVEPPLLALRPIWFEVVLAALAVVTIALSVEPTRNLFSKSQRMNFSYNPLRLVNTYGAFGSVTRERYEVVIEGTVDSESWREYEFKAKPGDPSRRPPQVAPYHHRIDWMMWFLPLRVVVTGRGVRVPSYEPWFGRFVEKLLAGDEATLRLLRSNPFPDEPPDQVRARFYRYEFTERKERRQSGNWWNRSLVGEYLRAVSRSDVRR